MRKKIITILTLVLTITFSYSQSKKDLLQEVEDLKTQLRTSESALSEVRLQERKNTAKVESYEAQVEELKETNNNLLKNLNSFTEASTRRSENINSTLTSLQEKERQLRVISDALSGRDSTTLALFTLFKQHLGPDAKITISKGAIAVVMDNGFLFGNNPQNAAIAANADVILSKIGNILKARQELDIEIITNSNLVDTKDNKKNNWQIAAQQASAVANAMEKKYEIEPKRIRATGISELGLYSIETATEIIVQPKFYEFYKLVKENMK